MRFCPYAERSVLVLNAKNLQYDVVFINLDNKPEWIFQYSPKGKYILWIVLVGYQVGYIDYHLYKWWVQDYHLQHQLLYNYIYRRRHLLINRNNILHEVKKTLLI